LQKNSKNEPDLPQIPVPQVPQIPVPQVPQIPVPVLPQIPKFQFLFLHKFNHYLPNIPLPSVPNLPLPPLPPTQELPLIPKLQILTDLPLPSPDNLENINLSEIPELKD
jgi:hypothetical protein